MNPQLALNSRYPLWFSGDGFLGATDEKKATTEAVTSIFAALRKGQQKDGSLSQVFADDRIKMLDVGCAVGVLGKMICDSTHEIFGKKIDYTGYDINGSNEPILRDIVKGESIGSVGFKQGKLEDSNGFPSADLVLASHVHYYPDQQRALGQHPTESGVPLDRSLRNVVTSLKPNGVALLIHETQSDFDAVKRKYAAHTERDTAERVDAMLKPGLSSAANSCSFKSHIYFPDLTETQWKRLEKAEPYEAGNIPDGYDKKLLNARILAEFVIHRPLDDMNLRERSEYLAQLRQIVQSKPLVTQGPQAEKFGPVRELTNVNQVIVRTHHRNMALAQAIKGAIQHINHNPLSAAM